MISGNIPEKIVYIYSGKKRLGNFWDDFDNAAEGEEVTPAFCADASNKKTLETGEKWARGWNNAPVHRQEYQNNPYRNNRVVSLEKRSEGGRAYKIITPDGFYFDLREDVLLDTILEAGVKKGGILNGEFLWAVVDSHMKLIRVGSELHKKVLEAMKRKAAKKLSKLEVGGVYKNPTGKQFCYIGLVDVADIKQEGSRYYGNPDRKWIISEKSKVMGFIELPFYHYNHPDKSDTARITLLETQTQKLLEKKRERAQRGNSCAADSPHWSLTFQKSHSFIEKIGQVNYTTEQFIQACNTLGSFKVIDRKEYLSGLNNQRDDSQDTIVCYSELFTVRLPGEKIKVYTGTFQTLLLCVGLSRDKWEVIDGQTAGV